MTQVSRFFITVLLANSYLSGDKYHKVCTKVQDIEIHNINSHVQLTAVFAQWSTQVTATVE